MRELEGLLGVEVNREPKLIAKLLREVPRCKAVEDTDDKLAALLRGDFAVL